MKRAIICDIDGTVALLNGRKPYGKDIDVSKDLPNLPVINLVNSYSLGVTEMNNFIEIIFLSGREDTHREATMKWLNKQFGKDLYILLMRKEGDYRKDSIVKRELFEAYVKDKYSIDFVLDDRDQMVEMWRNDLKLPCFQVAYGNF